jgi:LuxR family maltose regulon positive regulatory protein
LTLVAEGATNNEIAAVLGIGIETVKTLLRRTFAKLGVQRRVQAVWAARELGIV